MKDNPDISSVFPDLKALPQLPVCDHEGKQTVRTEDGGAYVEGIVCKVCGHCWITGAGIVDPQ